MILRQATPLIPVADIEEAARFFCDGLGFSAGVLEDGYAYLTRDGAVLRLIPAERADDLHDPRRRLAIYVDCDDPDALWAELEPKLANWTDVHVAPPHDTAYGQRELHVTYVQVLLHFGATIRTTPP